METAIVLKLLGIFLLTFVLEDAAVLGGAFLASMGTVPWTAAFVACFLGVWFGDVGLYALARIFGRPVADRFLRRRGRPAAALARSEALFNRYGWLALVFCRFLPGSRLPTYLGAGLLRMKLLPFLVGTAVFALGWVTMIFLIVHKVGRAAPDLFHAIERNGALIIGGLLVIGALVVLVRRAPALAASLRRWTHWEFWPPEVFYLPIAGRYLALAGRYGSLTLPSCANPGIPGGGLIGESKSDTLAALYAANPEWVAQTRLVPPGDAAGRLRCTEAALAETGLTFPFVFKPDVAQRGSGFKVIASWDEARAYLSAVPAPVILQEFVPGPEEFGIFYVRRPSQSTGRIFALTEKIFPVVVGDGHRSVGELILADARARIMAGTYLARFGADRDRVPSAGERVRLVEAGNHAQGCIFRDGWPEWTAALEQRVDAISRSLDGFFIGRYDVRFSSREEFRAGRGFKILEVNGAASEATNAYDARHSLTRAYEILFAQWDEVFAVADENRARGCRPMPVGELVGEMFNYARMARQYPAAD